MNAKFSGPLSTKQLASLYKALGHPARVQIVQELYLRQSCIGCDLVDHLGLAQSTTSEHLRILKQAGIIYGEIEHPRTCYRLNPEAMQALHHWLGNMLDQPPANTQRKSLTLSAIRQ